MARRLQAVAEVEEPEPQNAAEVLENQKQEHLECRDLRHPWSVVGSPFYHEGEVRRKLVCTRCGTEAVDRWSPTGGRIARVYKYAEGYKAHVGIRIKPIDVRQEVLNRCEVFASEDDMMQSLFSGGRRRKRA